MKILNKWLAIFVLCTAFCVLFIAVLIRKKESLQVEKAQKSVLVAVLRAKESQIGRRRSYYLYFSYQGKENSATIDKEFFTKAKSLQSVKLLHDPEYPDLFLQPGRSEKGQILSSYILITSSVFGMIYSIIKLIKEG
ncbi:hypothetical protein [Hymenobacter chitinivorans]|uniref:hypothetical protein n=1 Tax=Hymenobacter chitinivorans TaxID=89969 RepID=UPI000C245F08|nr:hypothetical protein [Hymenobacter chitinivorans]